MLCTVCNHPQRQDIDLALLNRTATLAQLSEQHRLSTSALQRHKQHLLKKMALTQNRFQELLRESYLFSLNKFLEMVLGAADTSRAEGNSRLLLQAVRQGTNIMKFMAKLDSSLTPGTIHRLLAAPAWADRSLLPTDLQFVADGRQTLVEYLFASCPEPGFDQEEALEAAASADLDALDPELLQNFLTNLSQTLNLPEFSLPAGNREKGGKKAKKGPGSKVNYQQYQGPIQCEKNSEKFPQAETGNAVIPAVQPGHPGLWDQSPSQIVPDPKPLEDTRSWIADLDAGRLDVDLLHAIGAGRPVDPDLFKSAAAA